MARDALTGSRIRERRMIAGLRQADLARAVGVSPSYLNLIEHNRRRIGGKLLVDIAQVLTVEPSMLTEGAEATLIANLREAAADAPVPVAEVERAEEFAGRFPGWAGLLAKSQSRISNLERTVQTLSDRLTHDPNLAGSLHEVLSTAAAIRSTASILAETEELEAEWQDRFHRNINQDAERLAESSRALVKYLDDGQADQMRRGMPQEEAEVFFRAHDFYFPGVEEMADALNRGDDVDVTAALDALLDGSGALGSPAAKSIARQVLRQLVQDARALPLADFSAALAVSGPDPSALLRVFGGDMQSILRRLAHLPEAPLPQGAGLVIADGSGAIIFRKPLSGFVLPGFGASCPLWPLYAAFHRPMQPIQRRVAQVGRSAAVFDCFAYAWPHRVQGVDGEPLFHSAMLILPAVDEETAPAHSVGSSCRVCPRAGCDARREPSILSEEF